VILVVDDEPSALAGMLDALTRRFGGDYRVEPHLSPNSALDSITKLTSAGEELALVIADQWMPEMTGNEFLGKVRTLEPSAKRALMVAWGDRDASPIILQACAMGQLDNYLYKPWKPAEVHLYPHVSEFLAEWTRLHRPGMELIHIVGDEFSSRTHEILELLDRNGIPYGFHQTGTQLANQLVDEHGAWHKALPLVFLLDGTMLVNPGDAEIMDGVGESPDILQSDVVVVGGGPSGLTAAVYAGSEGLDTLVVERHVIGGQAGASSLIRNYLGFPRGITGAELTQRAYQQAWLFGAKFVFAREVTGLRLEGVNKILCLSDGREIKASTVVIATGAEYRRLGVPELERFVGSSIFYTTFGESRLLKGLDVAVVGGGNSAGQAAVHLAQFARQVTLLVRGETLSSTMSDYLVQQIHTTPNIEIKFGAEVVSGEGVERMSSLQIRNRFSNSLETLPVRMLFVLIGALPHTDWLAGVVQRDDKGFIPTGPRVDRSLWSLKRAPMSFETSVPGIFAVGDVRLDSMKRVAAAVGEGAGAIQNIHRYLEEIARAELSSSSM